MTTESSIQKLQKKIMIIKQLQKKQEVISPLFQLLDSRQGQDISENQSNLIYDLVSQTKEFLTLDYKIVAEYILQDQIKNKNQIQEVITFYKTFPTENIKDNKEHFEKSVGVGIDYTDEQIQQYTRDFISANRKQLVINPYAKSLMKSFKEGLKFCEDSKLIQQFNAQTQEIVAEYKKNKENQTAEVKDTPVQKTEQTNEDEFDTNKAEELLKTYDIKKLVARQMQEALNPKDVYDQHQKRTNGQIITRFPPEPNGYLHIGHCKAIRFNFKLAQDYQGYTNLRYDDTNPTKENQEYIDKIKENVQWMGYTPKNIFFASDYFDVFYNHAITLIKKGLAFACKLSKEEAKELREAKKPSPYRDQSVEQNLKEFELMRVGYYDEKEIVLRAKIDYTHPNPNNRDPAIYRIMYTTHPHVGDRWCVYPLYDYVHCISDSLEDITHSCCTLEFENRRELYYWFLDKLNLYKPHVYEYGRLNLSYNVLSKRKLIQLIENKCVTGWDDPRLLTIAGIQRRGYPAEAINYFCDLISVARRGNDTQLDVGVLEYCIRNYLQEKVPHAFAVIDPFLVKIKGKVQQKEIDESQNKIPYKFLFDQNVYIEKSDVRKEDSPGFFGCAPGKIFRLRYGPFLKVISVNDEFAEAEIIEDANIDNYKKIKGILHWVAVNESVEFESRVYSRLYKVPFPGKETENHLDDVNKDSLLVYKNSRMPKGMFEMLTENPRWQFERKGFFVIDKDSNLSEKKLVMNQIIDLKQSKLKNYQQ